MTFDREIENRSYVDIEMDMEENFDIDNYIFGNKDKNLTPVDVMDDFDIFVSDTDFSDLTGNFKKSFTRVNNKIQAKGIKINNVSVPSERNVIIEGKNKPLAVNKIFKVRSNIYKGSQFSKNTAKANNYINSDSGIAVEKRATLYGANKKKISKVIVPDDRKVIVEGVSKFILSQDKKIESCKNLNYYKGEKLKEMVLIFNNDSAIDFNLELFNPSMPMDYLYSTSLNLNDKISVAGSSDISYSDLLFNILANPTMITGAKFVVSGANPTGQLMQSLIIKNKRIDGYENIAPYNLSLQKNTLQYDGNIICFAIADIMNRPYIPDGMDVAQYKVLAGNTVTMCFYYKQLMLKKVLFKEARNKNIL